MKNKIKLIMLTGLLTLGAASCQSDERLISSEENTSKLSTSSISNIINSSSIYIVDDNKTYLLNEDKSVGLYENENFSGNIFTDNDNVTVIDNIDTTGELILTNPNTLETITISNIRTEDDITIFDLKGGNGSVYLNVEGHFGTSVEAKIPIKPIIKAVAALVAYYIASESGSNDQANCTASLPKNCAPGKSPYAEYTGGWFNSSCNVGCR